MIKGFKRGERRPPRVVIYGPPKIGKSTWGADAPSPAFAATEEGVDSLPVLQALAKDWETLLANVRTLAEADGEVQTVVIDTLNGAAELASQHVCHAQFKDNWGPGGFQSFGHGWAATSEEMRKLLLVLDMARANGKTVILLAHTGVANIKNPIAGDYTKFVPDLDKKIWARFAAWADIIGRAEYEHSIKRGDNGQGKAVSSDTRLLRLVGSQAEDAGCRVGYDLPAQLPLSYAAFAEALGQRDTTAADIRAGWSLLTADEQGKALAYLCVARVEDLEKAQSQRAKTVLNRIQIKQQKTEVTP